MTSPLLVLRGLFHRDDGGNGGNIRASAFGVVIGWSLYAAAACVVVAFIAWLFGGTL